MPVCMIVLSSRDIVHLGETLIKLELPLWYSLWKESIQTDHYCGRYSLDYSLAATTPFGDQSTGASGLYQVYEQAG